MGTAAQFQEVVAGWEDQPPSWRERYFAELRHKKIIPTAKPGGGKGSVHLDKEHYVRGLLGLAASRPGEVDEAIQEFETLRCQGSIPPDIELPNNTLGEYLGQMLDEVALPLSKGEVLSPHLLNWLESWELLMCRVPPVGQVVTKTEGKREDYFFHGGLQPLKALTRAILLSGNALLDVGKMLADTYIYREMEVKRKASSSTKSVKTYGRLESAGTLRQKGTPAPSSYPARVNGSEDSLNTSEGNNDGNNSQGHLVSDDDQVSTTD